MEVWLGMDGGVARYGWKEVWLGVDEWMEVGVAR